MKIEFGSLKLKRTNKSAPPNKLTEFFDANPNASWDEFRDSNGSIDYNDIKGLIFQDQEELCCYCEKSVANLDFYRKVVEHFHPKSDLTDPSINWALDWFNLLGSCPGGADEKSSYQLPENLSCDAHKGKYLSTDRLLNPLEILISPPLFRFRNRDGSLLPNREACEVFVPEKNAFDTTLELVLNTLEVLNLNCYRLKSQRLEIFYHHQMIVKKAREDNNGDRLDQLAHQWFSGKMLDFFTTRRCLLGQRAEQYIS